MDLDAVNTRFTVIEREWKDSSVDVRADFRRELATMRTSLAAEVGPGQASARWLTRRIDRVARYLDTATD
ncbi:MAG: hypothetical protein ABJA16_04755 [Nakamurella sp.]